MGDGTDTRVWSSHRRLYMQRQRGKRKYGRSEEGLTEGRVAGAGRRRLQMRVETCAEKPHSTW